MNNESFNKFRITSYISSAFLLLWFFFDIDISKIKFISEIGVNTPKAIFTVLFGLILFSTIECLIELSKVKERGWQHYYHLYSLIGISLTTFFIIAPKAASLFSLEGISRLGLIIPFFAALFTALFASMFNEYIVTTAFFIKMRKVVLFGHIIEFLALISLLAVSLLAIYFGDYINNQASLIASNLAFFFTFIISFILMSPKQPIISDERKDWLKKKSESLDYAVKVNDLAKSYYGEENNLPEKKFFKEVRKVIKRNYERESHSAFPRYINLRSFSFELKEGVIHPVQGKLEDNDFVVEACLIDRKNNSTLHSDKIMFKYIVLSCVRYPISSPHKNNSNFIQTIYENAWKLQVLNETNPSEFLVKMAEEDENLSELKEVVNNKKPDINFVDPNGWTPLLSAVANGAENTAKFLLQKAADPSISNKHLVSPLHFASKYGKLSLCELLLKYKANIDQLDIWGTTPLMMAVQFGHSNVVKHLVENGANTSIKDTEGETAHSYAVKHHYGDIARYIADNGK